MAGDRAVLVRPRPGRRPAAPRRPGPADGRGPRLPHALRPDAAGDREHGAVQGHAGNRQTPVAGAPARPVGWSRRGADHARRRPRHRGGHLAGHLAGRHDPQVRHDRSRDARPPRLCRDDVRGGRDDGDGRGLLQHHLPGAGRPFVAPPGAGLLDGADDRPDRHRPTVRRRQPRGPLDRLVRDECRADPGARRDLERRPDHPDAHRHLRAAPKHARLVAVGGRRCLRLGRPAARRQGRPRSLRQQCVLVQPALRPTRIRAGADALDLRDVGLHPVRRRGGRDRAAARGAPR